MGQSKLHQKSAHQITSFPIIDLHCDLLWYLAAQSNRSPLDAISKSSFPQLKKGGVVTQLLPLSASDPSSLSFGLKQIMAFEALLKSELEHPTLLLAIENLSVLCLEEEPLVNVFTRIESLPQFPSYISLTWNGENRFGGGILSGGGLKEEGKAILEWIAQYPIAIDLSHASDLLAHDILNYIDQKGLFLPVMASHSNVRDIHAVPRNLPEEIAIEIIRRKGIIGLVLYPKFLKNLAELEFHIGYLLERGGKEAIAIGADFFCWNDFPELTSIQNPIPGLEDASCYPFVFSFLRQIFDETLCYEIGFGNADRFLKKLAKKTIEKTAVVSNRPIK